MRKISDKKYHLIFGESKTYKELTKAFENAIKSIYEFVNEMNSKGDSKSGIEYERGLISSNMEQTIFDEDDEDILNLLLYPENKPNSDIRLDDAFSIFVGYEIDITKEQEELSSDEFPDKIEEKIISQIKKYKNEIYKLIKKYGLIGYTFYIFVMPFTDIDKNRKKILKRVIE